MVLSNEARKFRVLKGRTVIDLIGAVKLLFKENEILGFQGIEVEVLLKLF